MTKKEQAKEKEKAFRLATTVFLIGALCSIIAALYCFEIESNDLGALLSIIGALLLGVSVWTFYHPFYPVLLGFILAVALTGMSIYYHPEDTIDRGLNGVLKYLLAGVGVSFWALIVGFQEWRKSE